MKTISLIILAATLWAVAILLSGCGAVPGREYYNIPVDTFSAYPSAITPLSAPSCAGN